MSCQAPSIACASQSNLVNFFLRAHFNVDTLTKPCKRLWSPAQAHEAYAEQQGKSTTVPAMRCNKARVGSPDFQTGYSRAKRMFQFCASPTPQIFVQLPPCGEPAPFVELKEKATAFTQTRRSRAEIFSPQVQRQDPRPRPPHHHQRRRLN